MNYTSNVTTAGAAVHPTAPCDTVTLAFTRYVLTRPFWVRFAWASPCSETSHEAGAEFLLEDRDSVIHGAGTVFDFNKHIVDAHLDCIHVVF